MNFKDALVEDLDVFTNTDEFGEVAIFSGSGLDIEVLLDKDREEETGKIIDVMTVKLSDVVGLQVNDTFTIGATVYRNVSDAPMPMGELMGMLRVEND